MTETAGQLIVAVLTELGVDVESPHAREVIDRHVTLLPGVSRTAAADPYIRGVEVVRVIDGDTFVCDVDLGFYVKVRMSCRLAGLNCNEHNEPGGPEARAELERLLALGPASVQSVHADKFAGRFDGVVIVLAPTGVVNVNASLIGDGYAVTWGGAGPRPHVPWPRRAPA